MFLVYFFTPAGGEQFLYQSSLTWTASACFWCTSLHLQEGNSFCTSHHLPGLHLHVSGVHTCDISLFQRELPIFCLFLRKSPYENFQNFLYILYISLFGITDLPTKIQEFPSLFNHSPYLEKKISLFVFRDVSHVCWCTFSHLQEGKNFCTSHHLPGLLLHVSGVLLYTCRRGTVSVPVITYLGRVRLWQYRLLPGLLASIERL